MTMCVTSRFSRLLLYLKYFSPEHVQAERKKCGYFPATRNALKSDRIRHEIVEDKDGNIGDEDGSYA